MIQEIVQALYLECGQMEMHREPTDLLELVTDVASRVGTVEEQARLRVETVSPPPPVPIDVERIERALVNLITNALKYPPPKAPVTIRLGQREGEVLVAGYLTPRLSGSRRVPDRGAILAPPGYPSGGMPKEGAISLSPWRGDSMGWRNRMRRRWYGGDTGLAVRMFLTMFLLAAVYFAFLAVLWRIGVGFFPLLVIAAALLGTQYYFSDQLVLRSMGARIVSPDEAPELHGIVERLSALADLPRPKVAIVHSNVPNAFATGRNQRNSVVAVTTALLDRLSRPELETVVAHELTHVKNRDVAVITIASFLSTVAFFILRSSMFSYGYGRGRGRNGGSILLVYLAALLAWVISFFLIRALSRYREYAADRGAAIITGAPSQLASALLRISDTMQRIPDRDLREVEAMNAFFIVPAVTRQSLAELFSTHPSVQNRIERLNQMQREMDEL